MNLHFCRAAVSQKAQGVTTDRTFAVNTAGTDREWAHVALSRGRQANTLYLANPTLGEECVHLTRPERGDPLDALTASLSRSGAEAAAIDQITGPPPPSSDITERVAWIAARRRAEQEKRAREPAAIETAIGR